MFKLQCIVTSLLNYAGYKHLYPLTHSLTHSLRWQVRCCQLVNNSEGMYCIKWQGRTFVYSEYANFWI